MKSNKNIQPFLFLINLFFITLTAQSQTVQLLRGPYLQKATDTSIIIRWRTNLATNSRVNYGRSFSLTNGQGDNAAVTTEHSVFIGGLAANTKYYYNIGSTAALLEKDTAGYFYTLPQRGKEGNYLIGVFGDCGNNSTNQRSVRNEFTRTVGGAPVNAMILLGDNAYNNGTDEEYQSGFFNIYRNRLRQVPLFPSPGNHDYANDSVMQQTHAIPYYSIFDVPVKAEAGGAASGNPAYYSYDLGNIHFIALDSYGFDSIGNRLYDTLTKQVAWLKADLTGNTNRQWVVVYFHHPPYTLGSHNSDTEVPLLSLRRNLLPILERFGVDLVLCGHSHVYERSSLMQGYYGKSNEFNIAYNKSNSNGRYDGSSNSCVYIKEADNKGTVYVVSGSAGQLGGQQPGFPMPAMKYSNALIGGSVLLQVRGNRLDVKWICADGPVRDQFTIMKDVNQSTNYTITEGDNLSLPASFITNYYVWSASASHAKSIVVSPAKGEYRITVRDSLGCLRDTFYLQVLPKKDSTIFSINAKFITKKAVNVSWRTDREGSLRRFFIERSVNNINFITVGSEVPQNNLMGASYSFTDTTNVIVRSYFYRVRSLDSAGQYRFSDVAAADLSDLDLNNDIVVAPNPSRPEQMRISFKTGRVTAAMSIYDVSGRLLQTRSIFLTTSPQPFLPMLRPGYYLVLLNISGDKVVKKILIL